MATSSLSGKDWWRANQAKFPNSNDIQSLEAGFRSNVEAFIDSLRYAGATVVIGSTRRHPTRAHLMHYSWKVAYREIDPGEVPKRGGLDIEWDHGDPEVSRAAAREMVNLFRMVHIAALTSNHIRGKAIDMTISWKGALVMSKPSPLLTTIDRPPRSGQNRELHEIGSTVFSVRKLASDPPHWSYNGK
jgi:hypothetical protein